MKTMKISLTLICLYLFQVYYNQGNSHESKNCFILIYDVVTATKNLTDKIREFIEKDNNLPINGDDCEYFLVGDGNYPRNITTDYYNITSIRNDNNFNNKRNWIRQPVLHAGLAKMQIKRNLVYNHNLRKSKSLKCVFIILNGYLRSDGDNGRYCYDMINVTHHASEQCDIELAIEYMEAVPFKVVIKLENNSNNIVKPIFKELSHKMPVLVYDYAGEKLSQICGFKKIKTSISSMKNPWIVCPTRFEDQDTVPIIKGYN